MLQHWDTEKESATLSQVADNLGMLAGALTTIELQPWEKEALDREHPVRVGRS